MPPSLEEVYKSSFSFRSDVPASKRSDRKCGMLHTFKKAELHDREEHAFAWIEDRGHENVDSVMRNLVGYGFDEDKMLFIPFSSLDSWLYKYPHACPYMECDENGIIKGVPFFDGPDSGNGQKGSSNSNSNSTSNNRPAAKRQKQYRKSNPRPKTLSSNATLRDRERAQLHLEIYNYLSWLHAQLVRLEAASDGRNAVRRLGVSVPGMRNVLTKFEGTFAVVKEHRAEEERRRQRKKDAEAVAADDDVVDGNEGEAANLLRFAGQGNDDDDARNNGDSGKENAVPTMPAIPLLEKCVQSELIRIVEENALAMEEEERRQIEQIVTAANSHNADNNITNDSHNSNANNNNNKTTTAAATANPIKQLPTRFDFDGRTFDEMFSRLRTVKKTRGDVDVGYHHKDADSVPVGKWACELRRRKRELQKRSAECAAGAEDNDFATLSISPGRLGLTLQFYKNGVGAEITGMDEACTFKERVAVGDRLITIDGEIVRCVEDLARGKDEKIRRFGIAKRRDEYPCTYLSLERSERLESIGFNWIGPAIAKRKKTWDERLEDLKQYKEKHGKWPIRKTTWEGIGDWIHMQRRYYRKKNEKFMAEKAPRLDAIGFPWAIRTTKATLWEDHVQKLVEFHRVNRHFDVPPPKDCTKANAMSESELLEAHNFYYWFSQLHNQYRSYKNGSTSRINEERANELIELGFEFKELPPAHKRYRKNAGDVPDIGFDKRVEQIQKFHSEVGHLDIDSRFSKWDNFGGWAANISKRYNVWKAGDEEVTPLEEVQFDELGDLGFKFDVVLNDGVRNWDDNFEALKKFEQFFGNCQVAQKYKGDFRLGQWVAQQRLSYKLFIKGQPSPMTQERCDKLEELGFLWEAEKRESPRLPPTQMCSYERGDFGLNHNDYCRMCYRKAQKMHDLTAAERKKKCKRARTGCTRCQEPICEACWEEGYDKHHQRWH